MKKAIALCSHGQLVAPGIPEAIQVGSQAWFDWISRASSFRYESSSGSFTAVKEPKKSGDYWTAHRRVAGKLRRSYLGLGTDLVLDKLESTSVALADSSYWNKHSLPKKLLESQKNPFETEERSGAESQKGFSETIRKNNSKSQKSLSETEEDDLDCDSYIDDPSEPSDEETIRSQASTIRKYVTEIRLLNQEQVELKDENTQLRSQTASLMQQQDSLEKLAHQTQVELQERNLEVEALQTRLCDLEVEKTWVQQEQLEQTTKLSVRPSADPKAITLLKDALTLKANAGGAIKRKIEQALKLL